MKFHLALLCAVVLPLSACGQGRAANTSAAPAASPMADPVPATNAKAAAPLAAGDPRIALAAKIPGAKPEDLRPTPVAGIYELVHGADISYISADGGFVFAGDMYKITSTGDFPNLSEVRRREVRRGLMATVNESQMLVFGPDKPRYTITVFTDVDCPWCRKLHSQIADYNKLGVRVRYVFYPRTGPDTESWFKAESVWCAADRKAEFTKAKLGDEMKLRKCPESPVAKEYKLGQDIGITGTPGIVLDSGELIPGYLSPRDLVARLDETAVKERAAKIAAGGK